jgi:hypothetical protein
MVYEGWDVYVWRGWGGGDLNHQWKAGGRGCGGCEGEGGNLNHNRKEILFALFRVDRSMKGGERRARVMNLDDFTIPGDSMRRSEDRVRPIPAC